MKAKLKGKLRAINIGEKNTTMKITIDPEAIDDDLLKMRGKEGIDIILDDKQSTLPKDE